VGTGRKKAPCLWPDVRQAWRIYFGNPVDFLSLGIDPMLMSAYGPKQTLTRALHMSAFGGKADMTVCGCLLSRSLLGGKRTWLFALHMSAFDPKRTSRHGDNPRICL